jgi:hypothetical protein
VSKSLKLKKNPNTGKFTKKVTETDVVKIIEKMAPSATAPVPSVVPTSGTGTSPQGPTVQPLPWGLNAEQRVRIAKEKMVDAARTFVSLIPLSKQNAITRYMEAAHVDTDADFLIKAIDLTLDLVGDM